MFTSETTSLPELASGEILVKVRQSKRKIERINIDFINSRYV